MRTVLGRRLPFVAAAGLAAAALGVILVIALGRGGSASTTLALQPGHLLAANASLTPAYHLFGDTVHARVDIVLDRERLDPTRVRVDTDFAPYRPVRSIERLREDVGPMTRLRYLIDLRCVTLPCLPQQGGVRRVQFPPVRVAYSGTGRGGRVVPQVVLAWPAVTDVSRLDPVDLEQRDPRLPPPWKVDATRLAAPSYGLRPGRAFWMLAAAAAVLVAASALLLRPYLPRPALLYGRRSPRLGPLEQALAVVEAARTRGAAEERKALELLAEELRRSGEAELAWAASSIAWAPETPDGEPAAALAVDVRRVIDERSNGDGH
jgi:hypothetical protein